MEKKYEELYKISLDDIEGFFIGASVPEIFKENNIFSIGELFEFFDKKESINIFLKSSRKERTYEMIMGCIKLLKYKYLGIDPNFDENSRLEDFGFSTLTINGIVRLKKYNCCKESEIKKFYEETDILELIKSFENESTLEELANLRSIGQGVIKEVKTKSKIINQYFREKTNKDEQNNDIKELYKELEALLQKRHLLEEQITIVQTEIQKRIDMVEKDGTNRKR